MELVEIMRLSNEVLKSINIYMYKAKSNENTESVNNKAKSNENTESVNNKAKSNENTESVNKN